jgi:hypothetical protein
MDNDEYLGKAVVAFMSGTGTALLLRNFFDYSDSLLLFLLLFI